MTKSFTDWLLVFSLLIFLLPMTSTSAVAADALAEPGENAADKAICPVCRVHEGETELEEILATSQFGGDTYGFCSEGCRESFEELPQAYIPPVFPRPAPAFSARSLEGEIVSTEGLQGKLTLVDFWATWCLPCVKDLPKLSSLDARYRKDGFQVMGISIDEGEQGAKKVQKMIRKKKAGHSIYMDSEEDSAWVAFQVRVVPSQFLVDEQGSIIAQWTGAIDLEEVENAIVEHLSRKEAAASSSTSPLETLPLGTRPLETLPTPTSRQARSF
ncbi:MAG: redoxin domain-containing protein [Deltaproteobacteria bacterium]|nr:redoxin domain-containing protein [Deltaproteobacteria bacterium]